MREIVDIQCYSAVYCPSPHAAQFVRLGNFRPVQRLVRRAVLPRLSGMAREDSVENGEPANRRSRLSAPALGASRRESSPRSLSPRWPTPLTLDPPPAAAFSSSRITRCSMAS